MVKRLIVGLAAAAVMLSGALIAPGNGAAASATAPIGTATQGGARLVVRPVSGPLSWFDISYGEVEGGVWRKVALVSFKVVGCEPGAYLYWSMGPVYQDGQQASGVFGGLGEGEDYCKADGTSTYGGLWYGEPEPLHRGWATASATVYQYDNVQVLATGTRRIRILEKGHAR
jgi:hypothetical protein